MHTLIGALIFLITIGLIMVRPRRVTEAIAAAAGALLMLLGGYVGLSEAITILRGQWKVIIYLTDHGVSCLMNLLKQ
jgi:Na+/H+ antiporter NhaD/arsenite permease-like protein